VLKAAKEKNIFWPSIFSKGHFLDFGPEKLSN
jgi:hypothetical protein